MGLLDKSIFHPIRRVKETIGLYDNLVYTNLVKNKTDDMVKRNSTGDTVLIDQLGIYQGDSVTFLYLIDHLPNYLHVDFKTRLRHECRGDTRITFFNKMASHRIMWNSPEMQSKLRILRDANAEIQDRDVSAFNMHDNLGDMRKQEWIQESLNYLVSADVDRNRALYKISMLVLVTGTRGEDFDESIKAIESYAEHLGIGLARVLYNIPEILSYYSPWSQMIYKGSKADYPSFVLTDELIARMNTYSQGTLGVLGICFGMDIYSSFPVLKRVKASREDAENWLITAETGGGKSYLVKALILQLLGQGYNGTIMDIEGFEYLPLAKEVGKSSKVQVINMAEGRGGYFDPVEIPIYSSLDYDEALQLKQNSVEFSLSLFRVLLGKAYEEDNYLGVVIDDAVSKTYADRGITEDRNTWVRSRGMTLFDIYDTLKKLKGTRNDIDGSTNTAYNNAVAKAIALTNKYFEPGGTRSSLFRNRVAIQDIIDADLIICSFGMAGKSQNSVDEVQMAMMQLGAAQLSHQRSVFSKIKHKFNFKLWEEFQRWGKFPGSEKTLGVALTGGRKLGDVNIIITNVVAELLGADRFNIFSNITSFLAGAIGDSKVREELCMRLSIPNMLPELNAISTVRNNKDEYKGTTKRTSIYMYSFLCGLDKTKYAVVKMMLPTKLRESDLFRTGVANDLNETSEDNTEAVQ